MWQIRIQEFQVNNVYRLELADKILQMLKKKNSTRLKHYIIFQKRNVVGIIKIPREREKNSGSCLQPSLHTKG